MQYIVFVYGRFDTYVSTEVDTLEEATEIVVNFDKVEAGKKEMDEFYLEETAVILDMCVQKDRDRLASCRD